MSDDQMLSEIFRTGQCISLVFNDHVIYFEINFISGKIVQNKESNDGFTVKFDYLYSRVN